MVAVISTAVVGYTEVNGKSFFTFIPWLPYLRGNVI